MVSQAAKLKKYNLKIILVGEGQKWGLTYSFKKALESLGCSVLIIDQRDYYSISFWNRVLNRLLTELMRIRKKFGIRIYFGINNFNKAILEEARNFSPHMIIFNKPTYIKATTLAFLSEIGIKTFAWHPDDIFFNPRSASRVLYRAMSLYDYHLTPRSFGKSELVSLGAKRVEWLPFSADTDIYYPEQVPKEEKKELGADIVFIGMYYEKYRAEILEKLCKLGFNLKVYGNDWEKCSFCKCLKERNCLTYKFVEEDDYRKIMNSSKIAIALLGKISRDQHTTRTFEIPACGTFMLHERTSEAAEFFKEGKEVEFFGSFDELAEKINYYLKNDEERKKIAAMGYKRAISFEHSYLARAQKILDLYESL